MIRKISVCFQLRQIVIGVEQLLFVTELATEVIVTVEPMAAEMERAAGRTTRNTVAGTDVQNRDSSWLKITMWKLFCTCIRIIGKGHTTIVP